ncbi:MAG TPA: hypothetical protein VGQ76_04295 [Thermoanaerobaculia bacterium]|nr:hypothetical protein [Thermoanaerobaculia bacterium]
MASRKGKELSLMKRAAILLTLAALLAFAPSAFACVKCNTTVGCYGTETGEPGRINCEFEDGVCHVSGLCQGFAASETEFAVSYTVAEVVVETEEASDLTTNLQKAEKAVVEQ